MSQIEGILRSKIKPKEKQVMLVAAVVRNEITADELMAYFAAAPDVDKGTLADVMKQVSAADAHILAPHIETLLGYINYRAPRVKWGVPEAIGNMAKAYPQDAARAVPYLLKNTTGDKENTTVIRWCAAYALAEIARHHPGSRGELLPAIDKILAGEKNNGVRNVYLKAMKYINKDKPA